MESSESRLMDGYLDLKLVKMDIFSKVKHLNDDIVQFGMNNTIDINENKIYLNLDKFIESYRKVVSMYREKLDVMDSIHDRNTYLDTELNRHNRLLNHSKQDYDTVVHENFKLKDTIKTLENNIVNLNNKLKIERTNKKIMDSNSEREKIILKAEKGKLEKELELLKDRMGKLITNPKKQYPSIEIANDPAKVTSKPLNRLTRRKTFSVDKEPGSLDKIMVTNMKIQLNDVLLENRELRESIVNQLTDLEKITGIAHRNIAQMNNNANSDDSDDSEISNRTFSIEDDETEMPNNHKQDDLKTQNKLLLEMPFNLIKENVNQRYMKCLLKLKDMIKDDKRELIKDIIKRRTTTSVCSTNRTNEEFLQVEIIKLKKKLKAYEELLREKERVIELAINETPQTTNEHGDNP